MDNFPDNAHMNLAFCDDEPIYIPACVQPFGVLLALDDNLRIVQISANVRALLGRETGELLGQNLSTLLLPTDLEMVRQTTTRETEENQLVALGTFEIGEKTFEAVVHRRDGVLLLELEASDLTARAANDSYFQLSAALTRLQAAWSLDQLCDQAAREVRRLTGFDQAVICRFDLDGSGAVVAKDKAPDIDSGSEFDLADCDLADCDLAAQEHAFDGQNRVRLVADANDEGVPLVPPLNPLTQAPLDLSCAALRSAPPLYIASLKKLGMAASLSISIVKDSALWGIIVCHHRTARALCLQTRAACDLLGQVLALQIASCENREQEENRLRARQRVSALLQQMTQSDDFVEELAQAGEELRDLMGASGAALFFEERAYLLGTTPAESEIRELVQWLSESEQTREKTLWQTQNLIIEYSKARDWSTALPGLLAISLSQVNRSYVLWFRPAQAQRPAWNNDLHEPVAPESLSASAQHFDAQHLDAQRLDAQRLDAQPTNERVTHERGLSSRQAFAMARGKAKDRAAPWQTFEIEAANELRGAISFLVLKRAEEMAQRAQELADSNRELESFSYSVSHDLRAPLRHINGFAALLHKRVGEDLDETSLHYLHTISEAARKGSVLVDNLLGFSRMARSEMSREAIDMNALISEVQNDLAMELQGRDIAWEIAPLPIVRGDREMLSLALRNLLGNAVKYTSRRPDALVEIGCLERDAALSAGAKVEEVVFFIRDNGAGFDMRYVDKIFGVFQRLHAREEFEGTGIGLANVQRIIARHGGRVWAQGEIDQGATIFFSLPRRNPLV